MTSNPLVSVIVPCFNVSKYVEKAISSILHQTYSKMEIWLVNDASTDDTLSKLQSIKDERIRLYSVDINTKKIGVVNEVLLKVTGDLVAFQDADDWSEPDRIQKQVQAFIKNPALGVCFTNYYYEKDKQILPGNIASSNQELKDEFLNFFQNKNTLTDSTVCPSMMISKAALAVTKGYHPYFKGRVGEDIQWIYRIIKSFEGVTLKERLYHYSIREDSLTGLQNKGVNAKAAYSWSLLKRIIYNDVYKGIDMLAPENQQLLAILELEACEETLSEKIMELNRVSVAYKTSWNYRIGAFIMKPFRYLIKRKNS